MPIMVFWCSFVHNFMFPFLTRTRKTAYLPWPCCLLRQRRISAPDSVSSPAQPLRSPAPAELYPVIISISCAEETDRNVSPAVITDRVQNNANFLIPFATMKIHCTFAKTFQVLSAYQYHELHCLKNIFIFVFRYFCRQETLRHVNCSGNNIT